MAPGAHVVRAVLRLQKGDQDHLAHDYNPSKSRAVRSLDCGYRKVHWALMSAALMIRPHLSISEFRKAASSSGVEPMTTTPPCSSFSLTAGSARAATVSV